MSHGRGEFWIRSAVAIGGMSSMALLVLGTLQVYSAYREAERASQTLLSARADEAAFEVGGFLQSMRRQIGAVIRLPWDEDGWLSEHDLDSELERLLQLVPQALAAEVCAGADRLIAMRERNHASDPSRPHHCATTAAIDEITIDRSDPDRPAFAVVSAAPRFGAKGRLLLRIDMRAANAALIAMLRPVDGVSRFVLGDDGHMVLNADSLQLLGRGGALPVEDDALYARRLIPGTTWTAVVSQPKSFLYSAVGRATWPVVVALLLSWAATLAVSVWIGRRVSRPVSAIAQGVEAFANGQLDTRVKVQDSDDEIGQLAQRFNAMADAIQRSQEVLESQVAARTRDLAQANDQLAAWSKELEQRVADKLREVERLSELKRFFSPRLAESLVAEDRAQLLQSHRREATVMFVDLRGFTAFAEAAPADRVMAVLREFHAEAGLLIFEFEGTLERFTGDGMMVFFNDPDPMPDHAGRAVALACRLRDRAAALMQSWQAEGAGPSGVGIGLSLGQATIGPIGFESRVDYAAIGTVTNRAARLCAEAAAGEVLICSALHERLQGRLHLAGIRQAQLKGLQAPETCYAVAAIDAAPADPLLTNAPAAAG